MLDIDALSRTDQLFDGRYRLLRLLSTEEAASEVWLAVDMSTIDKDADETDESSGKRVAIKIFRIKSALGEEDEKHFRTDYMIANRCRHANLLTPERFSIFEEMPYTVQPYCESGSSEQFIGKMNNPKDIWKFILDVASGLDKLHNNHPQIIHQDIRPSNILVGNDGNYVITGFGFRSRRIWAYGGYSDGKRNSSLAYMAPERFDIRSVPKPEGDIWAFGATLCELLTGRAPFGEDGGKAQVGKNMPMPTLKGVPSNIRNLVHSCLQTDPKKRPSASQIVLKAQKNINSGGSKWIAIILNIAGVLLLGVAAIKYFTKEKIEEPETVVVVPDTVVNGYEDAVRYLSEKTTAKKGLHILDSLVSVHNYQATFLMSRLYFNPTKDRDRVFYNQEWSTMAANAEITHDNRKAHRMLFEALQMNENDYVMLYELGCDYMVRGDRGCDRRMEYARWCFEQARSAASSSQNEDAKRYLNEIEKVMAPIPAEKPSVRPKE